MFLLYFFEHTNMYKHQQVLCFPTSPCDSTCLDASVTAASHQVLPAGYWWSLLYGTIIALLCLLVCLVGAHIYAKATFLIFLVVIFVLGTIFISFFAVNPHTISLPSSASPNGSGPVLPTTANFTGFKLDTLLGNLWGKVHKSKTPILENGLSLIFFYLIS